MGNPRIYYYPDGGSALEYVDLAEEFTNLEDVPAIRREDAVALDGGMSTAVLGPSWMIRITLERFGAPGANELERKLQALISHLRRGGRCGVTRDHARAFCAGKTGASSRGASYIPTAGNAFSAWSASAAIASGDEVAIEQAPPGMAQEVRLSSGMVGSQVHLSESTVYQMDPTKGYVWVRWRDFWPVCHMSAEDSGKNPLTHDHRRNYTLDLRLYFSPSELATVLGAGSGSSYANIGPTAAPAGLLSSATTSYAKSHSLESALAAVARTSLNVNSWSKPK